MTNMATWKDFVKSAQSVTGYIDPNFHRTMSNFGASQARKNNSSQVEENAYKTSRGIRGSAKGLKEAIPGLVDTFVGVPAGAVNGLMHGIAGAVTPGGSFSKGFSTGWRDSRGLTKDYMSDPIRYAEMYSGGNKVKGRLDDQVQYSKDKLEGALKNKYDVGGTGRRAGTWQQEMGDISTDAAGVENVAKGTTGFVATLPVWGKAFSVVPKAWGAFANMARAPGYITKPVGAAARAGMLGMLGYGAWGAGHRLYNHVKDTNEARDMLASAVKDNGYVDLVNTLYENPSVLSAQAGWDDILQYAKAMPQDVRDRLVDAYTRWQKTDPSQRWSPEKLTLARHLTPEDVQSAAMSWPSMDDKQKRLFLTMMRRDSGLRERMPESTMRLLDDMEVDPGLLE